MNLDELLSKLTPAHFEGDSELLIRAKLTVSITLAMVTAALLFTAFYIIMGHGWGAIIILTGALWGVWILFHMRFIKSLTIIGNEVAFLMFYVLTLLSFTTGGALAPNTMWFASVPVIAISLNGIANGIVWAILSSLVVSGMFLIRLTGFQFPMLAELSSAELLIFQSIVNIGLILFILAFCILFEVMRKKALDESENLRLATERSAAHLKSTTDNLSEMSRMSDQLIKEAAAVIEQIDTGASALSNSAASLANGASTQAASMEEIASSLNEIEAQTKENNENATNARRISVETLQIVVKGIRQMKEMQKSMSKIDSTSSDVSKIIKVIDEIAFQTNLLALNAAVEAARAGKYGKGFAVVAEEVRNLAARSAEAARNTTELIETSIGEVASGVRNSDQTAGVLTEIQDSVNKNNELVEEISAVSSKQTRGIGEVNDGLSQVNDVVQQNSAISEETASASRELSSQISKLEKMVGQFQNRDADSSAAPGMQKLITEET